ncbi:MAG: type VI secretion system baseplate subunit TssE [Nannocystales bacterium]
MARGILGRLASSSPSRAADEVQSIIGNLRAILNTRVGDAPAAPDFGVIDLCDLYHDFPNATQFLQRSIRETIQKFEPRLTSVRVRPAASDDPLTLVFDISARLTGDRKRGLVRVRTQVNQGGRVDIE